MKAINELVVSCIFRNDDDGLRLSLLQATALWVFMIAPTDPGSEYYRYVVVSVT